jgi:mediator of RNA polymerase II transcription subunit 5
MTVTDWKSFSRESLLNRTQASTFVQAIQQKQHVDGRAIAEAFLDCRHTLCTPADPLPPRYLDVLLASRAVQLTDVLVSLIIRWNVFCRKKTQARYPESDPTTLQDLVVLIASGKLVLTEVQVQKSLLLSAKWLSSLVKYAGLQNNAAASRLVEPVGTLLANVAATDLGAELLSGKGDDKNARLVDAVSRAVEAAAGLFPAISTQLAQRLSNVQKHIAMFSQQGASDMQAMQFSAGITELQMAASRAGTYTFLYHLLDGARTVDDNMVFNFLAGRHNDDFMSMFLDVIFASFLVLKSSSGTLRQQTELYIRNKLPSILATISTSSFESFSAEQALTDVWTQLDISPELMVCAKKFIHVCSLQHVIPPESASRLINDQTLLDSLTKSLYTKEELVTQLTTAPSKTSSLITELLDTDGNGAVISQAVVEVMVAYIHSKETHHLKEMADALVRQPGAINALALFLRPVYWIAPASTLLDEWRWDEIHGESQPLYDEFGSILLLIITTQRRLRYPTADLDIKGFVLRYLDTEGADRPLEQLPENTQKHLAEWINAFYVAEGLNDELTTNCSPHEFYTLVPILVQQSLLAHNAGKLTLDALKGGLEYFLEPFLLPSLVSAIAWAKQRPSIASVALAAFTKPTDNPIHQTIVKMLQTPAEFSFGNSEKVSLQGLKQIVSTSITAPGASIPVRSAAQAYGGNTVLSCLLDVLMQSFGGGDVLYALDLVATLVCTGDIKDALRLRYQDLGALLKKRESMMAMAIVHLYRRVEAYASVFVVQETNMEIIALPNIGATNVVPEASQDQSQQIDDIDQVLNDSAALNAMDNTLDSGMDGGMDPGDGMDSFYMPDDNMGLGDLGDLDLDMF